VTPDRRRLAAIIAGGSPASGRLIGDDWRLHSYNSGAAAGTTDVSDGLRDSHAEDRPGLNFLVLLALLHHFVRLVLIRRLQQLVLDAVQQPVAQRRTGDGSER